MALLLGLMLASIPLLESAHRSLTANAATAPLILAFGVVGTVVATRRPRHPTGWILLGIAMSFVISGDASTYSTLVYRNHDSLPAGWLAVLLQPGWSTAIVLFGLAVLLFPDGHLPTPRWRWALRIYLTAAALWVFGAFAIAGAAIAVGHIQISDNSGDIRQINHPTGVEALWAIAQNVFFGVLFVILLAWLCTQISLFRRSTGERRQQLKWLISGGAISVLGAMLAFTDSNSVIGGLGLIGVIALPIALGFGILKYRLYEIDVIVRKTLVYAVLIATLGLLYLGGISLLGWAFRLLTGQSGALAVTFSTLAVAALFQPLRSRIQRSVDHRFYRARYNAVETLDEFTGKLRGQIELDAVSTGIVEVVNATVQPRHATLWLRPPTPTQPGTAKPEPPSEPR